MIASLPMYDRPEAHSAHDRFWQAIRKNLGYGPEALTRDGTVWDHWASPELILSQTCGYPYRAHLHGKVTLIGAPDNRLEGCKPGEYCSVFIARKDDTRDEPIQFSGSVFAYNEPLSQSGWAAPAAYAKSRGFGFEILHRTGGHAASAEAVASGKADLAALDALTWRMVERSEKAAEELRVIAHTTPTPTLPYITALSQDPVPIREALRCAMSGLSDADRKLLSIYGLVETPAHQYLSVPNPTPPQDC